MVSGGICGQQWTDRIVIDGNLTAHRYINQVLRPVLGFVHKAILATVDLNYLRLVDITATSRNI